MQGVASVAAVIDEHDDNDSYAQAIAVRNELTAIEGELATLSQQVLPAARSIVDVYGKAFDAGAADVDDLRQDVFLRVFVEREGGKEELGR